MSFWGESETLLRILNLSGADGEGESARSEVGSFYRVVGFKQIKKIAFTKKTNPTNYEFVHVQTETNMPPLNRALKYLKKKKINNRWNSAVCNQKQSVCRVFAQVFMAKELRKFVQNINMSRKSFNNGEYPLAGTLNLPLAAT
ncbi:hypothetical protein JHK85_006681 [Glycine max]|nr:hypothetical protein JHK85_006681 [Glycine max]